MLTLNPLHELTSTHRRSLGATWIIGSPCATGYTLQCKYKGLQNTNTQIRASFSEGGDFIICGSDDGSVYFWSTKTGQEQEDSQPESSGAAPQEKSGSYEFFHAHNDIATVAVFAPQGARRSLRPPSPRMSEKVCFHKVSLHGTQAIAKLQLNGGRRHSRCCLFLGSASIQWSANSLMGLKTDGPLAQNVFLRGC